MKFEPRILAEWQKTVIQTVCMPHFTDSISVTFDDDYVPFSVLYRDGQYIFWDKNIKKTFKTLPELIQYLCHHTK